jgi:hypothetical protein
LPGRVKLQDKNVQPESKTPKLFLYSDSSSGKANSILAKDSPTPSQEPGTENLSHIRILLLF